MGLLLVALAAQYFVNGLADLAFCPTPSSSGIPQGLIATILFVQSLPVVDW